MKITNIAKNLVVGFFALIWLFPIAVLLVVTVKNGPQYLEMYFWALPPIGDMINNVFTNFRTALFRAHLLRPILDTLLYAGVASVGCHFVFPGGIRFSPFKYSASTGMVFDYF